ncbi:MAG: HAMP domain-containing protein [Deltaproteobacteria bacterium]|nr:MAG: HAMP domain-containing protein [Deltaproteobacteria bacterium]
MFSSIKAKIIVFYTMVLFVSLCVLGIFLYLSLGKIVYDSIDSSLLSRAKALATLIDNDNNETEFNFSDEVMWEYNSPKSKSFFQIRRLDGTILEKSASLRDQVLPFQAGERQTTLKTVLLNGTLVRVINFHISEENGHDKETAGKGHGLIIQCAEDIQDRISLLKNYRVILYLSILSIMLISVSGGFLIAKKALTPVKEISEAIDRISESNLSERIAPGSIPEELRILASSFNHTFDRLERSFKRQTQFTADASHELRTPLSVILSQGEIMLRKERTAGEYKDALTAIMKAARMMSEIVQKLLIMARLTTDKGEFKAGKIDLSEIIHEAVKLLRSLAEQKGISINISADGPCIIIGDRPALLELFVNLVDNAIKYNVPQGKIDISMRKETGFIVAEVKDTGMGIPEEDIDRVFDRFYRVDKSRSRESGGVGLGLSICDEIVNLYGGRIDIKSKLGAGTTVSVYLPHPFLDLTYLRNK